MSELSPSVHSGHEVKEAVRALDTLEVLMKAYEDAGIIKPVEVIGESLGQVIRPEQDSQLKDARDDKIIGDLVQYSQERDNIHQLAVEMLNLRRASTEDSPEVIALWAYAKSEVAIGGLPRVIEHLRAMTSSSFADKDQKFTVSEEAQELASDVYWMIHRQLQNKASAAA